MMMMKEVMTMTTCSADKPDFGVLPQLGGIETYVEAPAF